MEAGSGQKNLATVPRDPDNRECLGESPLPA
jgi:hypothetical protein